MKKFIDYCKEKYKILIPLMVVFVLLITVYFLYREYKYDNTRKKVEYDVTQYFGGIETNYKMEVSYNLNDQIVSISSKDRKVEYDSTPVYFKDKDKVLFPREMTIAFPMEKGTQYKLYKYSVYENGKINNNGNNDLEYNNFFLYDGDDLYFFPSEVTLYIDNREYTKLGKMSYVSVVGGYTMVYYDNESKKAEFLEIDGKKVEVKSDKINVDLTENSFMSFSSKILLFSPDNLSVVSKTN